tara:strand:+ start:606 stop:1193 length:588 start_codon:yes stop_codon:yes gene_type:complete
MKRFLLKNNNAFTLVEVIVGMMLISFAITSAVGGVSQAHGWSHSIYLRHRALEELSAYMDSLKTRIADLQHFSSSQWVDDFDGTEVVLHQSKENPINGIITREVVNPQSIKVENFPLNINPVVVNDDPSYHLRATIQWKDYSVSRIFLATGGDSDGQSASFYGDNFNDDSVVSPLNDRIFNCSLSLEMNMMDFQY